MGELNASDERGIQVVREKVKNFAQQTASGKRSDGAPCPPFKIIILDEADSMTKDAQSALRTMEKCSRSTKFCLICNYVSRIIEPITSRCSKFRFKPIAKDVLVGRIKMICDKESVKITEAGLEAVITTSEGDLRKAITSLQRYARLQQFVDDLVCEGFSGHQLINQLHDEVVTSNSLNDQNKAEICAKLATAESCLLDGADEYLQVMSVATYMMKVLSSG